MIDAFDAVTIAFGLRNLPNVERGTPSFSDLNPGGKLVVLEFSSPVVPGFQSIIQLLFLARVLPRIGGMVSGSRAAYTYLPTRVAIP